MRSLLLAVDISGFPSRWLFWQDAICQETLGKVAYGFGDHEFTFTGGKNRNTGLDSQITLKSILMLRGRSPECNKRTTIPLSNAALFRRDQFMCAYCGTVGSKGLTRDHITPLSRGGIDSWLNCCACCVACNARKGSQTLDELGWKMLYAPYVPNHQEGLILANRHILDDQMELLKSMCPKHSRLVGHA